MSFFRKYQHVAAKELNRDFIGMELNDTYYNTSVKRINDVQNDIESLQADILNIL